MASKVLKKDNMIVSFRLPLFNVQCSSPPKHISALRRTIKLSKLFHKFNVCRAMNAIEGQQLSKKVSDVWLVAAVI
jgi:hypothetical protein